MPDRESHRASITHFLRPGRQVIVALSGIAGRRVQAFVAEDLGKPHEIVVGVGQVSVA